MKNHKTLHMIGNAHIDPVWLWQWYEGFHEVLSSFRSALDRLNEDNDFTFVSSSAAFYEWVEKSDPGMFAEIQRRVAEGRWEIVGGWWIQPDCNIPGGESFVRQALYGQRYFYDKFGVTARVGYNVDSFGHHAMLPQLLKKSGLDTYVFMRPGPHEKGLPGRLFWWEADDGSRVLTLRLPFEYCTWGKELDRHVRRCAAELKPPFEELMCFYGVGNHGGGPTQANIASIHRLNEDPAYPRLVFSSPDRYFRRMEASSLSIPVVHDELQHHASGCYAAHSAVKRWNREAENRLLMAEKLATIAHRVSRQPYPGDLDRAWKNVLFNQFHDILAGTSVASAYQDAQHLHGEAMAIADRALNSAVQSLAWNIQIPQEDGVKPVVVFNPHAWNSRVNVEVEIGGSENEWILFDDQGHQAPVQRVQSEATARGRSRLSFTTDLPSLGYRLYRLVPATQAGATPAAWPTVSTDTASDVLVADVLVADNGRLRLEIDTVTGSIRSLRDHRHGLELLAGPGALPVVIDDPSDTWSHNVFRFDKIIGTFKPVSARLVEHGPVKSVLRVVSEYGVSRLIQDFTMYTELDQIDVRVTVDWREQFKMLKLRFPLNLVFMRAVYEIPFGHIERVANGEEEPIQSWIDVSGTSRDTGERYGLSILNDGKYSADVNVRDIGLTVLRSPIYAHHMPMEPEAEGHYTFIDQGIQRFTYTLLPHAGSWEEAGTVRRAAELNQRPFALVTTYHPQGTLPPAESYLTVDQANVNVTVLKQAEDGNDLVLRCYETARSATEATIRLPRWNRVIHTHFDPCEIKTFRIPIGGDRHHRQPVRETNLLEWDLETAASASQKQEIEAVAMQASATQASAMVPSIKEPSQNRNAFVLLAKGALPGVALPEVRPHPEDRPEQPANGDGRDESQSQLYVNERLEHLVQRFPELATCVDDVRQAFELLAACYQRGGKVLLCGNGGSAADCEHIVGELMKGYRLPRPLPAAVRQELEAAFPENGAYLASHLQGALPALSLVSQVGLATAYANDVAADMVFAQQVYGYGRPGDVVIGISTSGNSKNVIHALQVAQALGLYTLGFTGFDSGAMKAPCDVVVAVPQQETAAIQELHLALYHELCAMLEERFWLPVEEVERKT
ncbi:MAG TPA: glycoside hydrolase family 38 C-terminal domain-containing protein [Anaerolineae bacterium]